MNPRVYETLEYHKIITRLSQCADSEPGKSLCLHLEPLPTLEEAEKAQEETAAAVDRIRTRGTFSFSGLRDLSSCYLHLEVGGSLNAQELLWIARILEIAGKAVSYGNPEDSAGKEDALSPLFAALDPLIPLAKEITRCILSPEEISDDASSELKKIRRSLAQSGDRIRTTLNHILNSSRTMLQDSLITLRNNRYCLPVKAEYRNAFPGIVHDQSSTGSTLFMEPMAVVNLNNEIADLLAKEQEEINRILLSLSQETAQFLPMIREDQRLLIQLDFLFAKGKYAGHLQGSRPAFSSQGRILLKKARHPLIPPKEVVPIDLELGDSFHLLIVTGPNTGGKTVSLKTLGLLTLMGQAGLQIPAFDGSILGFFSEVYGDIGDEQSIEQSLSTFSSHMVNTVSILQHATNNSLVLFDELGAGTDPTEGAALAIAILSELKARGTTVMATTHYAELKVFALETPEVENACCEFDVETLRPTYRLLMGIPGKSNAFAISQKLGLSSSIIAAAKAQIDAGQKSFEDLLTNLEENRVKLETERATMETMSQEIASLKERLTKGQEKMEGSREKLLSQAKAEANAIIEEAKAYADTTIRNYNKWEKSGDIRKMEHERNALNEKLASTRSSLTLKSTPRTSGKEPRPEDFHLGDAVRILSLNTKGTIAVAPNPKGDCTVQMGILRSKVNIRDLELLQETPSSPVHASGRGSVAMEKSATIHPQVNLIGMTVDEGLAALDKYLDDAYLSHLPQVTVIHGRGTGALKTAVHGYLKKVPYVKSYRLGEFGEGGNGATIVEFK